MSLADRLKIPNVLVLLENTDHVTSIPRLRRKKDIIFAVTDPELRDSLRQSGARAALVTFHDLARMPRIRHAITALISDDFLKKNDRVVCVSGLAGTDRLDGIIVLDMGREFEDQAPLDVIGIADRSMARVVQAVVDIALELGYEGREGTPVGGLFVIGDSRRVMERSRQLVFNPFKGYPEEERNVMDPVIKEGIKEFAMIDGAFIIRVNGTVLAAGRYLEVGASTGKTPPGLGARHAAAASITEQTEAIAVVVSETSGTVRVFKGGKIVIEIGQQRRV